jgi:tRNA 5-methylaminomethyl-2-thiouridine biosynthesis bifunctional protein
VSSGGLWFADGGWMRPASLVAAQLAAGAAGAGGWTLHAGSEVRRLARADGRWSAIAADGTAIAAAPVCVLANAHDAARLAAFGGPPPRRVRGQLTRLPPGSYGAVSAVLAGTATLAPLPDGPVTGASYDFDDTDPVPRLESHTGNLARLMQLLPDAPRLDAATLTGAVAFRSVAHDRLPLIGAVPDVAAARAARGALAGAHLADLPRLPGVYAAVAYGSRGLTWAALGGEILASLIEGDPLPLEAMLADAIDPGRFVLRQARQAGL